MSHIKRIFVWTILLIGSAVLFYFWATNQMYMMAAEPLPQIVEVVAPVVEKKIEYYQNPEPNIMQILLEKSLNREEWSTTTLKIGTTTLDGKGLAFTFPRENTPLYQGCTYRVDLDLGKDLNPSYMGVILVDAGTKREVSAKSSGLEYSLTFKDGHFLWSVGNAWVGEYYLTIPVIDGVHVEMKSPKFAIREKPEGYVCEK